MIFEKVSVLQRRIENSFEHLRWSYFAKIVKSLVKIVNGF